MDLIDQIKDQLGRRLTVMLVPHSDIRPIRLQISMALLVILGFSWTGMTLWSGYIVSRHVDYWRAKSDEQILKAKVWYFSRELRRSREYIDRVKETEIALQNLLKMKTRRAIVESDHAAAGGPTPSDQKQVTLMLAGVVHPDIQDLAAQFQNFQHESCTVLSEFEDIRGFVKEQHQIFRATPVDWPTKGRLTSYFGMRHSPIDDWGDQAEFHRGIDIANEEGTPVRVTADGVVRLASWEGGYGRMIIVDHGYGYQTYYAHNERLLVKPGDLVKRGQIISYMGTSGRSTGYHLHYEVWHNGRALNPLKFVKATE